MAHVSFTISSTLEAISLRPFLVQQISGRFAVEYLLVEHFRDDVSLSRPFKNKNAHSV